MILQRSETKITEHPYKKWLCIVYDDYKDDIEFKTQIRKASF